MSALTDLFTSLATKIRSKVGGAQTYTPAQMVSAIDDVYDAGVAAGTTPTQTKTVTATTSAQTVTPDSGYALSSVTVNPQSHSGHYPSASTNITTNGTKDLGNNHNYRYVNVDVPSPTIYSVTPSNSIPPDLETSKVYRPTSAGYAIADYDLLEPSNSSPASLSSGHMYAADGSGYAIESYSSKTPSDSSPASLSSGSFYKMGGSGYAISSYANVTPSADGTYFSSGMKKMSSSGYAYSSKPTPTETTLWTNNSPTSNFSAQTVTLSQDIDNFTYLRVYFRPSTTNTTEASVMVPVSDFKARMPHSGTYPRFGLAIVNKNTSSSAESVRGIFYESDTTVYIGTASGVGSSTSSWTNYSIPTKITGIKF